MTDQLHTIITPSADVMSGTPVFAGTRVPLKNLLDYLRAGDSVDTFLEDFPAVRRDQIETILALAETLLLEQVHARAA